MYFKYMFVLLIFYSLTCGEYPPADDEEENDDKDVGQTVMLDAVDPDDENPEEVMQNNNEVDTLISLRSQLDEKRKKIEEYLNKLDIKSKDFFLSDDPHNIFPEDNTLRKPSGFDSEQKRWIEKMLSEFGLEFRDNPPSEEQEENPEELLEMLPPLPEEPPVILTPEEEEAEKVFQEALEQLKKTRSDKAEAYRQIQKVAEGGHKKAQIKMAWAYLFGDTVERDIPKAVATFTEFADTGDADGHTGLGLLYASGIGVNVSQARALLHLTMGAIGNNVWAQMAMGYRYLNGLTVSPSCEKALDFYRKVATEVANGVTLGGSPALHRIRLLDEQENSGGNSGILDKDLIEYYQLLAEKGDIQTQIGLGQLHYQGGRGVPLDIEKALHYFQQAANVGNAVAMSYLGKIYLEGGEGVKADNETALKYLKKAVAQNDPVGQSTLGIMYLQGRGIPQDTAKAFKYFSLSAEQGWVEGQLQLGHMHYSGVGVRRDLLLANKYFSLASQSGHVLAFYYLAQMHALGMGMMRSCTTAVELFKNVAERGKWGERLMIAYNDYKQYNANTAYVQYAVMADLGYEVAQSNAAFLLDRGDVTLFETADDIYCRALHYWGRSASQGYSPARVKLGDYHFYGYGTEVDYEAAAGHYRLASEQQQNAQAMFNLGYMHERGLGMRRDIHLAKRCYDQAAETSADARVPVALALFKLNIIVWLESIQNNPIIEQFTSEEGLFYNWDIYLITTLSGFLCLYVYMRRPLPP